jgi:hypothetical protein
MIKTGTKIRQNTPLNNRNGGQVAGGSDSFTPTIYPLETRPVVYPYTAWFLQ